VQEDRFRIETLLQEQHTLRAISRIMVIDVSVISRECKRNRGKDGAHRKRGVPQAGGGSLGR
jgi:IS30 family transposase